MIEQEKERFREQEKTENQRKDFAHKVSTDLVNRFDLIAFENLNREFCSINTSQ